MRLHNVGVIGSFTAALALSACASDRDGAEDIVDGGKHDASFGLPDASVGSDGGAMNGETDAAQNEADGGGGEDASGGSCGDGVVGPDERCDVAIAAGSAGACPTSCGVNPQNSCARATLVGSNCWAQCEETLIAACTNDDGCCANGCTSSNDNDCQAMCGNGLVEGVEVCDGNCPPANCDDGNRCTVDSASGDRAACNFVCLNTAITACQGGDGCCAPGCNNGNDSDCSASCGDMIVNNGEQCDGNCPTTCNDSNACTTDVLSGTQAQCNVQCTSTAITICKNGDGCCPSSCRANNDNDCMSACRNGIVEPGEECEPTSSNDASCSQNCLLPATECLNGAEARGEVRTDACVACGCNGCNSQLRACYEATDVAAGGPAMGTSRATLCAAVVDCGRTNGCNGAGCYLGPCKAEIERAAESTSLTTILSRQTNKSFALGRANAVSECSVAQCATPCML